MKLSAVGDALWAKEIFGGDPAAHFFDAEAASAPLPVETIDGVSPMKQLARDGGLAFEVVGVNLQMSGGAKDAALRVDEAEVVTQKAPAVLGHELEKGGGFANASPGDQSHGALVTRKGGGVDIGVVALRELPGADEVEEV